MTNSRFENRKYTFTVEGQTEKWYFQWLGEQIRNCDARIYDANVKVTVQSNPESGYKKLNGLTTQELFHVCDVESSAKEDIDRFKQVLLSMKNVTNQKRIDYILGYSNFTFELWMILHKQECNHSLTDKKQYLKYINQAFGEQFENLSQYKNESCFKRCLSKLTLEDVKQAIVRADALAKNNKLYKKPTHFRGYSFYLDNPALSVHEIVKRMIQECIGN